jgi:hypothetical protein
MMPNSIRSTALSAMNGLRACVTIGFASFVRKGLRSLAAKRCTTVRACQYEKSRLGHLFVNVQKLN